MTEVESLLIYVAAGAVTGALLWIGRNGRETNRLLAEIRELLRGR